MLALSHELQYPVDEKCDILLLVLQQTENVLNCQGMEKICQVYSYNNHQYLRIKLQESVCSHKFKNTFNIASSSINLYVFSLSNLTKLKLLNLLGEMFL